MRPLDFPRYCLHKRDPDSPRAILPRMEISPIRERIAKLESRLTVLRGHL
jgi:hypothetical protein